MTTIAVGGVSLFSIDSLNYDVGGDLNYEPSILERATLTGMTGVQGYSNEPKPGKIEVTIRDNSGVDISTFNAMSSVVVLAVLRNGKRVLGSGMWQVGPVSVDPKESTIKLTFEGPNLQEF